MIKFAKYFFIVFLITTILPLVLMFAWNNSQIEKMHAQMSQNAVSTGKLKLEHLINSNLKAQEGDVLKTLYFISATNYNIDTVKKLLKGYKIEITDTPVKQPESFYERKNFDLYSCTVLPFNNSTQGLKIFQKVDINQLRPSGPYNLELSFEEDNGQYLYKNTAIDPLAPHNNGRMSRLAYNLFKFSSVPIKDNVIEIKNDKNQTIAYLSIKLAFGPFRGKMDNIFTGLIILFVGIISSFIIGLLIKKVFVLPIMALSKATKEIKKGNFSFKLDGDSKVEIIKNIYNNFNDMSQNLETKEKLRTSFISNLTHDLRTPLVSQAQSLQFISDKFKEIGLQNEYELAESLAKNNEHLLKMVNLILESYSFDSSKLKLHIEPVNLYEIVEDCQDKLKPLIHDKKIKFVNDIYKSGAFVDADLFQLTRVFINLLSNAIENTGEDNYIKIAAKFEKEHAFITIEDNGNGIAPEDLKFIFDRYYSGKSLERKLGAGFGLSVCEKLINMHGGKISVESELNQYTRFTIQLPIKSKRK